VTPVQRPCAQPTSSDDRVVGLGAECDVVPAHRAAASPGSVSFDVREFALLADGRRAVLHEGERGFAVSGPWSGSGHPLGGLTAEDIRSGVLTTVLPDEDDGEDHPWEWLAALVRAHGVRTTSGELRELPYTVELSDRVQRMLATSLAAPEDAVPGLAPAEVLRELPYTVELSDRVQRMLATSLAAPEDAVPGLAPAEVDEAAARFSALVTRWDLAGLRRELSAAVAAADDPRRTSVPAHLLRALELYLDVHAEDPAP